MSGLRPNWIFKGAFASAFAALGLIVGLVFARWDAPVLAKPPANAVRSPSDRLDLLESRVAKLITLAGLNTGACESLATEQAATVGRVAAVETFINANFSQLGKRNAEIAIALDAAQQQAADKVEKLSERMLLQWDRNLRTQVDRIESRRAEDRKRIDACERLVNARLTPNPTK